MVTIDEFFFLPLAVSAVCSRSQCHGVVVVDAIAESERPSGRCLRVFSTAQTAERTSVVWFTGRVVHWTGSCLSAWPTYLPTQAVFASTMGNCRWMQ